MIKVEDLVKNYGNVNAIRGVSFEIEKGETFAMVGPNGAGKTTLLNAIVGLIYPSSGRIFVDTMEVTKNAKEIKKRIGYVPQRISFHENLSVFEVIQFYGALRGVDSTRLENVLSSVGILGQRNKKVGALSGGMLQRLALAQAVISDPPILILDEPTISLDPEGRVAFKRLIREEKKKGKTILLSSHILSYIEELADRIAILVQGKIIALDTLDGLRTKLKLNSVLEIVIENMNPYALKLAQDLGAIEAAINGRKLSFFISPENKTNVIKALLENGFNIQDFWTENPSLEEIFIKYTEGNSNS
ncbi:MAG: ABC transporter ATP-binding protein [Candidatus Dadabacteria bacterium]|nr:ABC transporter ATP-binding protein [Candidatus Dadabacteria bacterium]